MPRLLISVRNAAEARNALAGGADLIDIKEPQKGALGAAHQTTWREVCRAVRARCPVSIALGELLDHVPLHRSAYPPGIQFAKIGLAGCARHKNWKSLWREAIQSLPQGLAHVAVVYADATVAEAPAPDEILRHAQVFGCQAMLVDTYQKKGGDLFDVMPDQQLRNVVDCARAHGLTVVLGGSLNERTMLQALQLSPDFVAFRGAVCQGSRTAPVDRILVQKLAKQLAAA